VAKVADESLNVERLNVCDASAAELGKDVLLEVAAITPFLCASASPPSTSR